MQLLVKIIKSYLFGEEAEVPSLFCSRWKYRWIRIQIEIALTPVTSVSLHPVLQVAFIIYHLKMEGKPHEDSDFICLVYPWNSSALNSVWQMLGAQ